jgi:hypothetical protein
MATTNLLQTVSVGQGTTTTTISAALHADLGTRDPWLFSFLQTLILEANSSLVPRIRQLIIFVRYFFQARPEVCQAPWRPRACPHVHNWPRPGLNLHNWFPWSLISSRPGLNPRIYYLDPWTDSGQACKVQETRRPRAYHFDLVIIYSPLFSCP